MPATSARTAVLNVFKYMQQALSDYASNDNKAGYPAKDIDALIESIDESIVECDAFLQQIGINLDKIVDGEDTLDKR